MNLTAILRKCRGVAAIGLLWTPLWTAIVLSIVVTVSLFLPLGGDVDVARIVLKPLNPESAPIVLDPEEEGDVRVIAEFVEVMG